MTRVPAKRWETRADLLKRIEIARQILESPIGTKVPIDDLAKLAMISPWHFVRLFKETYGTSPKRHAANCRLDEAKKQLQNGERVAETALKAGYESLPSFSREFKKRFGHSPAHFRNLG